MWMLTATQDTDPSASRRRISTYQCVQQMDELTKCWG
jgi:hypothetical protein